MYIYLYILRIVFTSALAASTKFKGLVCSACSVFSGAMSSISGAGEHALLLPKVSFSELPASLQETVETYYNWWREARQEVLDQEWEIANLSAALRMHEDLREKNLHREEVQEQLRHDQALNATQAGDKNAKKAMKELFARCCRARLEAPKRAMKASKAMKAPKAKKASCSKVR